MKRNRLAVVFLCVVAVLASTAAASVTFTLGELSGLTIDAGLTTGFTGVPGVTASPTYSDGQTPMSGAYGGTGNLNPNFGPAVAYYGIAAADLLGFNARIASGLETLLAVAYNDNNQVWELGIWYDAGAGVVTSAAAVAPFGGSSTLALAMPASVLKAGVFVRNILSPAQADDFHASWSPIPEPTTVAVWGGLIGIAAVIARLNRKGNRS